MNVLILTVFLSTLLAALFLLFFIQERRSNLHASPEQDALRPFTFEKPRETSDS